MTLSRRGQARRLIRKVHGMKDLPAALTHPSRRHELRMRRKPARFQRPAANSLVGAALIIGSSIVVILRERYLARKGALPRPAAGAERLPHANYAFYYRIRFYKVG